MPSTRVTRKRKRGASATESPSQIPEPQASNTPGRQQSDENTSPAATEEPLKEETSLVGEETTVTSPRDQPPPPPPPPPPEQRNFDKVHFGEWLIKTWYFSPYPLFDNENDEENSQTSGNHTPTPKTPGTTKVTARSHGRTSDLLAGGLGKARVAEKAMLWVCEMCFKYMADGSSWELHRRHCAWHHPPGRKVYQRGAHIIWEVDGAQHKLYCQNLSLFGKLFINVKTLFFDCDNFLFYILTDATSQDDHMLGYFSKEKLSYDDYNLACIMTLPPYQKEGYGMLMIEFSYELSRRSGKVGTPERPLSELGLRSYLAYWVSTLIRFFRRVLSSLPPEVSKLSSTGTFPDLVKFQHGGGSEESSPKRKKRAKGWDGEDPSLSMTPLMTMDDPMFTTERLFETSHNPDGSALTQVSVRCTLSDIARATNLRVEDAAFALSECGLLSERAAANNHGPKNGGDGGAGYVLVITREMVEKVAVERKVKRPCMEVVHVHL